MVTKKQLQLNMRKIRYLAEVMLDEFNWADDNMGLVKKTNLIHILAGIA